MQMGKYVEQDQGMQQYIKLVKIKMYNLIAQKNRKERFYATTRKRIWRT